MYIYTYILVRRNVANYVVNTYKYTVLIRRKIEMLRGSQRTYCK